MLLRCIKKLFQIRFFRFFSFGILCLGTLSLIFIQFPKDVYSVDLTLVWDEISEEDLSGYKIFYREEGQSYNYAEPAWEGTEKTCIIYNLNEITTYYFVVRAFNASGFETNNSNEVSYPQVEANTVNINAGGTGSGCFIGTTISDL